MNLRARIRGSALGLMPLLAVCLLALTAHADYLEVRRTATLKDRPVRDAVIIERPAIGSFLPLLDDGRQTNGYYRVIGSVSQGPGWIYRTLVRRFPGDAPGIPTGPTVGSQDGSLGNLSGDIMRAHFIDVGQGDAALLEFACGAVLIDAGGQDDDASQDLIRYLTDFFDRRTDLRDTISTIFVTHTHIDHNRSLRAVVENFTVQNYVHNGVQDGSGRTAARWMINHANDNGRQINLRAVSESEILQLPRSAGLTDATIDPVNCSGTDPNIQVLAGPYEENPGWPPGEFENGNNKSLVIRIDFGESSFLFTGDLEEDAIGTLVEFLREQMCSMSTYTRLATTGPTTERRTR